MFALLLACQGTVAVDGTTGSPTLEETGLVGQEGLDGHYLGQLGIEAPEGAPVDEVCDGGVELELDAGALTGEGVCSGENPEGGALAIEVRIDATVDEDGVVEGSVSIDAPGRDEPLVSELTGDVDEDGASLDFVVQIPGPPGEEGEVQVAGWIEATLD